MCAMWAVGHDGGKKVWWAVYGCGGLSVCFVCVSEEHPCVFSLSPFPSSPFSKDFMYTAFMLFCLMKIV